MPKYIHTGSWTNRFPHAPGYSPDEPLTLKPGETVELDVPYDHPLLMLVDPATRKAPPRKAPAKKAAPVRAKRAEPDPDPTPSGDSADDPQE